jgi:ABC-type phosphate transport system auxiliary subunit
MANWFNDRRESFQDQVDETYRGQLRELNELNFARFDAKLEQRVAEVKAELRQEMAQLRTELADLRANLVKWMFVFWMGQAGLTVGLALLVVGRR